MADEMRIEYMALSELLRTERNPKKHDLPSLRASMLRWGFTQPLAIDERTGKLVEGHGRIEVLQEIQKAGGKPPLRGRRRGCGYGQRAHGVERMRTFHGSTS